MIELLAPAGSMEALQAAINGGADAIYVGGSKFNARAYATNFDIKELTQAVKLCHLHGVKLYVTVNTVYKENEIEAIYDYLRTLYEIQVDAVIVQDEGLMNLTATHFKYFEVHASTQCSIHNLDGIRHFERKGVKRVVLARENTLEEIRAMANQTNVEIEAFVHGALCVAYSGQCYLSQSIGQRSANRGQCAQPCRLPYTLYQDTKKVSDKAYLMSCKDLCTIEHIDDLIQAGIKSFKIEGRMKRPEYVYAITHSYRQAIDKNQCRYSQVDLKQLFNRDFSQGYLFSEKVITSSLYSGNRGILLGKVVHCRFGKVAIKALIDVQQGDGIRFGFEDEGKVLNKLYYQGRLVNRVEKGQIFEVDSTLKIKADTPIYRTTSFQLEKEINAKMHSLTRRMPITMQLEGRVGFPLKLTLQDQEGFSVTVVSNECLEKASKSTDLARIEAQLAKLGQTIYQAKEINLQIKPDIFIPIAKLNELRRLATEKLDDVRMNRQVRQQHQILPFRKCIPKPKAIQPRYYHFHTQAQFEACLPYLHHEPCFIDDINAFKNLHSQYSNLGLAIPTICSEQTFKIYDQIITQYPDVQLAVNNSGAYERYQNHVALLLPGLNLTHLYALESYDLPYVMSVDLAYDELKQLEAQNALFVRQIYGHCDVMTTKHCPVSVNRYNYKKEYCKECAKGQFALADRIGAKFPLLFTNQCITQVLSEKPIHQKNAYHAYIRFTIEDEQSCVQIIKEYQK